MLDYYFDNYIQKHYEKFWNEHNGGGYLKNYHNTISGENPSVYLFEEKSFFEPDMNLRCMYHMNTPFGSKPHRHEFFELIYVYKGEIRHTISGQSMLLRSGDLCIVNPNATHCLDKASQDMIVINILIRPRFLSQLYNPLGNSENVAINFFFNCFYHSTLESELLITHDMIYDSQTQHYLHIAIRESFEQKAESERAASYAMMLFFLELTRSYQNYQHAAPPGNERVDVNDILHYIEDNLNTVTLPRTAEHFHYHPTYLPQYLKQHTGHSFNDILQSLRISAAKNKLIHTDKTAEEIAEEIGYNSVSSFYRTFRKWTSLSPQQYRKRYTQENR